MPQIPPDRSGTPGAVSATLLEALLRHSSDAAIVVVPDHGVTYASPAITDVLGIDPEQFVGRMAADWIHPEDLDTVLEHRRAATATGHAGPLLIRGRHADETWRWFEAEWWQPDGSSGIEGTILHFRDVSAREEARRAAARSDARLSALLHQAADVVLVLPRKGAQLSYVGPSVERVTGWTPEAAGQMTWDEVIHPDHLARWNETLDAAYAEPGLTHRVEVKGLHADGTWRWLDATLLNRTDDPLVDGVILHFHDVTDRHLAEQELARRALHDDLTGLPNRTLLVDRLSTALGRAARGDGVVAVMYCDLDRFKTVNDSIGHRAADSLLVEVAGRLEQVVRGGDTVARLHGDEFVVCAEELDSMLEVRALAERVRRELARPFSVDGREVHLTVSIGLAVGEPEAGAEELLERADAAMYVAKTDGKDRIAVYDQGVRSRELSQLAIRNALREAIEASQLRLHYQPVYELSSGRVIGTEALVRWDHPERGLIPPAEFIPVAEESGAIVALGDWVLRTAAHQALEWGFGGRRDATMWVNISARQLARLSIVDDVRDAISDAGIPPTAIGLEVTETALIERQPAIASRLAQLRTHGCSLAIDDFGTGYSSLLYLRRYAADTLKIDRSFVAGLAVNRDDTAIVSALRNLALMLDLRVVAEGVETQDQLQALRAIGCDSACGYLLAPPAPAETITRLLDRRVELHRPA